MANMLHQVNLWKMQFHVGLGLTVQQSLMFACCIKNLVTSHMIYQFSPDAKNSFLDLANGQCSMLVCRQYSRQIHLYCRGVP